MAALKHLSCFHVLTDEGVVGHGKLRSVVIDVQHLDEDGNSRRLAGVVWTGWRKDVNEIQSPVGNFHT